MTLIRMLNLHADSDGMQQGHHAALRVGVNLNVFEKLDESDGAAKSSKELAKMTGADPHLIGRS